MISYLQFWNKIVSNKISRKGGKKSTQRIVFRVVNINSIEVITTIIIFYISAYCKESLIT